MLLTKGLKILLAFGCLACQAVRSESGSSYHGLNSLDLRKGNYKSRAEAKEVSKVKKIFINDYSPMIKLFQNVSALASKYDIALECYEGPRS